MKIYLLTLGCDKNRVDTEHSLAVVLKKGHILVDDPQEADVMVVNTCCFIEEATQESIDEIFNLVQYKKENQKLVVMGCLTERFRAELTDEIPEIDFLLGTSEYLKLADLLPEEDSIKDLGDRILTTPNHYSYLKISEGCNNHCTYCIIPSIRGNFISYPIEDLVKEAEELADKGVKELIIVAQDSTRYGEDLYGEKKLPELLERLSEVEGIEWVRLLYAYPESITEELIETMANNNKILKYIDMPLQHSNDRILKLMGRQTNNKQIRSKISMIRDAHPDFTIRTTFIAGFPGETEEEFQELYDFVKEMKFDRLGVFPYSKEEGTPAYNLPNQLDSETKQQRADYIMEIQQDIHFEKNEELIGKKLDIIIDGVLDGMTVGRSYRDTPDVDSNVFIKEEMPLGEIIPIEISETYGYDLIGFYKD